MPENIRNFCIIAHIDHGKSTLADRLLEITQTVSKREMKEQFLDQMDIERERGITIKLQPVRMEVEECGKRYIINLIDTPGHVDFTYEVSRSLAAVEGALLLVDATQGVQAQTLANLYLALEQDLTIIPVINKIDLSNAQISRVQEELMRIIGCQREDILLSSAKTGQGVREIIQSIIRLIPPPSAYKNKPLRALIFDSVFDEYRGVIAYVRIVDGRVKKGEKIKMLASKGEAEALEVGVFKPQLTEQKELKAGEIGYIVTGLKDVHLCRVGDTIASSFESKPLPGYKVVQPMVYAGIFCKEGNEYHELREAMEKLKLNDAALIYEPENSPALGFGFRCGFLGLLHLEIFQQRLQREYGLDIIVTTPSVAYKVFKTTGEEFIIKSPQELPDESVILKIEEPIMDLDIFSPKEYIGGIMQLVQEKRGVYLNTEYLDDTIAVLHYKIPLATLLVDFYDKLKSISSGYATMNYVFSQYQKADIVKMKILVAQEEIEALSTLVYRDTAFQIGKKIVQSLKKVLPRQLFEVKLQAALGGKIIAAERIPPLRKDVTAKLYGGDYTRKRKLLEKQKAGKKRMKAIGRVELPPEAYLAVLKR